MASRRRDEYLEYVLDQLSNLGTVRARRMFGGAGIYYGDDFFGIVHHDTLYFKVDDHNRGDYTRAGMTPFAPFPNRPTTLKYYAVPLDVIEDPSALVAWARGALAAARLAATARSRSRRRDRKS